MKETKWQVYKFGGTSVGQRGRLPLVLRLIECNLTSGRRLAVVVSALGDTTDWLVAAIAAAEKGNDATGELERASSLALEIGAAILPYSVSEAFARQLADISASARATLSVVSKKRACSESQRGEILAFGELTSVALVTAGLLEKGINAQAVDAREFLVTNGPSDGSEIDWQATTSRFAKVVSAWDEGLPVVTGFIARTREGDSTTLGRNGSDYTAALVAALLDAESATVWTDVPGVMTADPALVAEATPVDCLSYDEALELAYFGTRMLHPRTVIPLREKGIELCIRSTIDSGTAGTRINAKGNPDFDRPTCVTSLEHLALLSVHSRRADLGRPVAFKLASIFQASEIRVWLLTESTFGHCFSVVVPKTDEPRATGLIQEALKSSLLHSELVLGTPFSPVTMVTLVGQAISTQPDVAGRFLGAVGRTGVAVRAIAQGGSQRSISCIVDADDTSIAVRTVHAAFNLAHAEISAFVIGKGVVGRSLLGQLHKQERALRTHHDVHVRLVGVADRSGALFKGDGLDPSTAAEKLSAAVSTGMAESNALSHLIALARSPNPVLVDCTAAEGMEYMYAEAFALGINVVSANKKPLSLARSKHDLLKSAARQHHRAYHYGTTVGAALPIIETLKNLIRTGDRVTLIEGAFSGTLGYLCEQLSSGERLSVAVRRARQLGFTEPHPGDDLSGMDVARKALILAREMGLALDLEDVLLHPFVSQGGEREEEVERFIASLEILDVSISARVRALHARGRSLRYLARIEPETLTVRVGPVDVDARHPAATLRGSEAFVAFYTERYSEYPLIVRGAGAGGEVTASGVLADILKLAQNLRGRA